MSGVRNGAPASRLLRRSTRRVSRSLDTIINGESSMFMDVNGDRFLGAPASRRLFIWRAHPKKTVMAGLNTCPGHPRTPDCVWPCPAWPLTSSRRMGPRHEAGDDGRGGGWDENILCRLRRLRRGREMFAVLDSPLPNWKQSSRRNRLPMALASAGPSIRTYGATPVSTAFNGGPIRTEAVPLPFSARPGRRARSEASRDPRVLSSSARIS
jgi:hypothetical protein